MKVEYERPLNCVSEQAEDDHEFNHHFFSYDYGLKNCSEVAVRSCSSNRRSWFRKIHMTTPALESLFKIKL